MFLDGKPVLHMVDESTHYTAAAFLKNQAAAKIWRMIERQWTLVYLGPPDFLAIDQGSSYMSYISREMRENLAASGLVLEEAPVETLGAIGVVERYHAPLRAAYSRYDRGSTDPHQTRTAWPWPSSPLMQQWCGKDYAE